MAGAGFREFVAGEVLTAAQVQTYLQDQSVMVFDDSASRSSALGTLVSEGMLTYLKDTDALEVYDSSSWQNVNDNTNSVALSTFTEAGQMLYSTGTATVATLGTGIVGQVLQSNGTSIVWADTSAGGSTWFDYTYSPTTLVRYGQTLEAGYYWFQVFDKNGGAAPTGTIGVYDDTMTKITDVTITASASPNGDALGRLNLASTATYLTFSLDGDCLVVITNSGEAVPADASTTPTIITTTQSVVLSEASDVYIFGGGGAGAGRGGGNNGYSGGGSGYLTLATAVPAGTYSAVIGAGGAGSANYGAAASGGITSFGAYNAAGGVGGNEGTGGDGGSGGAGGRNSNPNSAQNGVNGGVDGNDGTASNGPGGTGSGVSLPWFIVVPPAATADTNNTEGGGQYGGGAGATVRNSYTATPGGSGNGYGGGGGGCAGVRANSSGGATAGGDGADGAIFIVAAS